MLNVMSSFFQARKWQICGWDSEVSFQNSTLSLWRLQTHYPLRFFGVPEVLVIFLFVFRGPTECWELLITVWCSQAGETRGAPSSGKWDASPVLCLVCSGEKAGGITWQSVAGGVGMPFLPQNLGGCHQKITFVLQRRGPETGGKPIEYWSVHFNSYCLWLHFLLKCQDWDWGNIPGFCPSPATHNSWVTLTE